MHNWFAMSSTNTYISLFEERVVVCIRLVAQSKPEKIKCDNSKPGVVIQETQQNKSDPPLTPHPSPHSPY
jgi:hypothetical protein